ncbi:hypothetical protein [Burkholderia vietnamiensis]|uniref:hypothetical protein n=1 Tax=Burkholderia vietnamiensis TaxID=60552 RepID=UPI00264DE785|nr:hypothetical protein [Burkholderia vietnamiensis]MDN7925707.1 hypothetical protein [Burkholderia vietnamiensis]
MRNLRCKVGDLARIVCSKIPGLIGRTAVVERRHDCERWAVTVLGEPVFGIGAYSARPVITNRFFFRDSSLVPLRGDEREAADRTREVNRA